MLLAEIEHKPLPHRRPGTMAMSSMTLPSFLKLRSSIGAARAVEPLSFEMLEARFDPPATSVGFHNFDLVS